ncbi:DUF1064 domain-containing protein [Chitinophaga sp. CF418]|uniref:DUF1064 domain-containing protein n=1 Tax=Chitinophaga sp. CF418 TaxID=1855287 RepID=UPI00091FB75E|nr:Protein of unknown function [Chitinophaga sp. CF418]
MGNRDLGAGRVSGRHNKYGAKKIVIDGIRFASTKEGMRYTVLRLMQRCGEITDLKLQPSFALVVDGYKIATYRADFSYYDMGGNYIVEDVKGVRTPVYRLKKKLVHALHGIEIKET